MNRLLLLGFAALSPFFALANNFNTATLSGHVVDADKKPLEFVVITLLKATDSSLVKGSISAGDGAFQLDNIDTGSYLLEATFTGFTPTWYGPFSVGDAQALALPDILMQQSVELQSASVFGIRPLYVQKPDMLIMDVENSPVRLAGNAWELLGTAPGVTTDQNGNVTLRGKSGVKIYIDGKNSFLAGDQLMTRLQQISAADVVRIEIISNPSAKYDAEGSAGIINIVTRKGSQLGFNGTARLGLGQAFYFKNDAGFEFNYAKEKFNLYGKAGYSNYKGITRSYIDRNVPYNGQVTNFNQHSDIAKTPYSENVTLGIDFYAKHNITWGARIDGGLSSEHITTTNNTRISVVGQDTVTDLSQINDQHGFYNSGTANLYFRQELDTNGGELSASVDFLRYHIGSNDNFDLNYSDNFNSPAYSEEFQRSKSLSDITIAVGQVDYSHPFGKTYKLETGLKSSYVETANDLHFDYFSNNIWVNDTLKSNAFIYKEQINAAYGNGYADFGNWQFELGLRAEQTISTGQSPTLDTTIRRSYTQFFPSVFILQKIGKNHAINYSYSRRINRPAYDNLNPFVFYLDKYTFELGNPNLKPEIAHNAEITYSFMEAVFATVGATRTRYSMTDVTNQVDSTGIGYKTTVNLDHTDNAYFGLGFPVPIGKWFFAQVQMNESYAHYSSYLYGTHFDRETWSFNADMNMTVILPKDWKIQAWGWYNSGGYYGMFLSKPQGGVGGGISKSLFEKQLFISLNVFDIFHTSGMRASINYQTQDVYLEFIPETPRVFLRVRYTFGNTKAQRKTDGKSGADELKDRTSK